MTPLTTDRQAAALTILQRAVCFTLSCHYLGNDRHVDLDELVDVAVPNRDREEKIQVDEAQFSASMKLVDPKILRAARRKVNDAKAILRGRAVSAHRIFGERTYLIPVEAVVEVDAALTRLAAEIWIEAGKVADVYEAAVEAQAAKIGPALFKRANYLTPDRVRAAYSIDWDYVSFESPERLESINHVLAARSNARHEARLASAYDDVVASMRAEALDVLVDLEDKLDVGQGERPKVLRDAAFRTLEQFMAHLPQRNLAGDDRLAGLMDRIAGRMAGVTVDQLRTDAGARAAMRAAVGAAKMALAELVEEAPIRSLSFGRIGSSAA